METSSVSEFNKQSHLGILRDIQEAGSWKSWEPRISGSLGSWPKSDELLPRSPWNLLCFLAAFESALSPQGFSWAGHVNFTMSPEGIQPWIWKPAEDFGQRQIQLHTKSRPARFGRRLLSTSGLQLLWDPSESPSNLDVLCHGIGYHWTGWNGGSWQSWPREVPTGGRNAPGQQLIGDQRDMITVAVVLVTRGWPEDSESHDAPQNIWHKSLFRSWICTAFRFIQFVPKKLRLGLGSRLRHSKDL